MSLCLLALLTACASTPERPPIIKLVPVPAELTQPVAVPELQGDTNAALVDLIERLRVSLGLANGQLQAIGNIK